VNFYGKNLELRGGEFSWKKIVDAEAGNFLGENRGCGSEVFSRTDAEVRMWTRGSFPGKIAIPTCGVFPKVRTQPR